MALWSYGDSHAAGHELCRIEDLGQSWIQQNYGYSNRLQAKREMGLERYQKEVRSQWYDFLRQEQLCSTKLGNSPCSPELSFAGQLASQLKVTLNNRAIPGSSNDQILFKMLEDRNCWGDQDKVIVSVVTPHRFAPQCEPEKRNFQLHTMPKKAQDVFLEYGPWEETFKLWSQGLIYLAAQLHKNIYLVRTTEADYRCQDIDLSSQLFVSPMSFVKFVQTEFGGKDLRYPGGHFSEKAHSKFADYLISLIQLY